MLNNTVLALSKTEVNKTLKREFAVEGCPVMLDVGEFSSIFSIHPEFFLYLTFPKSYSGYLIF